LPVLVLQAKLRRFCLRVLGDEMLADVEDCSLLVH
jgi:hypothetical protein